MVFLPCITILVSFSPGKRQQHHLTGEAGQSEEKTDKWFGESYRSCRGWLCSPLQRCSNHRYRPSWAASWAQGRTQCQYHGGQGWDAPAQSRSDQSPCRARCGAFRSCYPNNLSWRGQWTAWPGWWHHGWRWPPLWSTSHPDPHDRCSRQWQRRPVNQTRGQKWAIWTNSNMGRQHL